MELIKHHLNIFVRLGVTLCRSGLRISFKIASLGNPAIHHPHAPRLAVRAFNLAHEFVIRSAVFPFITSQASGNPSCVITSAATNCRRSGLPSRL